MLTKFRWRKKEKENVLRTGTKKEERPLTKEKTEKKGGGGKWRGGEKMRHGGNSPERGKNPLEKDREDTREGSHWRSITKGGGRRKNGQSSEPWRGERGPQLNRRALTRRANTVGRKKGLAKLPTKVRSGE